MATTLASQLKKLAVPQTSILEQSKKRPSLLFDEKEAAAIDRDTFFEIGISGLQDLKALDADFGYFDNNLFSQTSRAFERSIQDAETNENLNKTIKKFFMLLSPYLLLKSAHKTLEWLIQRYSIHEYNKDDLFKLILPYHETNIFVKCLRLLNLKKNDDWNWLYPLQKKGVHLPKVMLYNHCASNAGFLKFVVKIVLEAVNEKPNSLTTLFTFYCTTTIGTLQNIREITEPQLTAILPPLLKGLSSDIPDYIASAYMITAQLVKTTKLSHNLLNALVERISSKIQNKMRMEATLVLLLLYQSQQKHFDTISNKAARNLAEGDWFVNNLGSLAADGSNILPLWTPVLRVSLKKIRLKKYKRLAEKLFTEIRFEDSSADVFIRLALEYCPTCAEDAEESEAGSESELQNNDSVINWYASFLKKLENQYPNAFDKIIREILSHKSEKQAQALRYVMNFAMSTGNDKSSYTIFEKLYHPNSDFRLAAVDYLVGNFSNLNLKDREILQGAVSECLLDEDSRIIKAVLKLKQKELIDLLGENSFVDIVKKLLIKCVSDRKYFPIISDLVGHIRNISSDLFLYLLPFLFPVDDLELKIAKKVAKNYNLRFESVKTPAKFCEAIYNNFPVGKNAQVTKDMLNVHKYLSCLVVTQNSGGLNALLHINSYLSQAKSVKIGFNIFESVLQAKKGCLPLEGLLECLKIVLNKTDCPKMSDTWQYSFKSNQTVIYLVNMLKILVGGCYQPDKSVSNCYKKLIRLYFDKYFPDFNFKIAFLSRVILFDDCLLLNTVTRIRITKILVSLLSKLNKKVIDAEVLTPAVLTNLISDVPEVRLVTFDLVDFLRLWRQISKHREEILLDAEQLPLIMGTLNDANVLFGMINEIPVHVSAKLLKVLTFVNSYEIFEITANLAINVLKSDDNIIDINRSYIVYNVILRFDQNLSGEINLGDDSWKFIKLALQNDNILLEYEQNKYSCPSLLMLEQITPTIFNNLSTSVQKALLETLITTATSDNPNIVTATYKTVKNLHFNAELLIDTLTTMQDLKSNRSATKKRKLVPTIDILDLPEWKRGITVLEFIQNKKITNSGVLLPILFGVLKKCLDFDEQSALEYPKQLILSSILHICNNKQDSRMFNVEAVVQCIRASPNPQTHHHALLVLAHVSEFIPEQVLHNIMAIFTFMGSSVLRHDDAYSFQIITKIIDTIIPILVRGNDETVADVLRVFVDVMLDIPEHRRTALFIKLLTTLGTEYYLWLFLVLTFEAHIVHVNQKRLDIAANISLEFPPEVVIITSIKLLEHLKSLPTDKLNNTKKYTPKQIRHYKYTLVTFLSTLLSSKQLVNSIATLNNEKLLELEPHYKSMLINILTYIQTISKIVDTQYSQYWKVILHHCFDIMDSINALLTSEMFLLVIRGLIVHNIATVRRKAMEILNTKLQNHSDNNPIDPEGLFALIPPLLDIIKTVEENKEPEQELTQQTALLSLKLLIKLLATNHPDKFVPILNYITDLLKSKKLSDNILASVVLCLSELCNKLRAHAIPKLVKYMPALIKLLKHEKEQPLPNLLLLCILTALQKIVESLPLFLSPYLEKILCELCTTSAKLPNTDKLVPFIKKINTIKSNIASKIPTRILLPQIIQSYNTLLSQKQYGAIVPLMNILSNNLSHLQSTELTNYSPDLTKLFLNALEFRMTVTTDVETVEDCLIATITVFVLKLSETTFRPFYYRLFDWATREQTERIITFYRLSFNLAENLKSLFVLFADHFINNAASLLKSTSTELLINNILLTLKSVFSHDCHHFVNKDRFEILMQPIVDQLENSNTPENILISCISQFAVAIADDSLWKQLNYQILLKTRHNSSTIRLAALNCLCEVARKLGEDFLPLLPETIPFLAELLEDENEQVEKRCQEVIQDLEKALGEPLQKYF